MSVGVGWIRALWPWPGYVITAFAVFSVVLDLSFLSDDHVAIWRTGPAHETWRSGFFRPFSELSFSLGHWLHGPSPSWHRAFNVALHGTNAFLVFRLFRSLVSGTAPRIVAGSWFAGTIFLVYPFHLESIVWIVGRESSLATFFVLLGLLIAMEIRARTLRIALVGLCFLSGTLCYESALLLPVLWVLLLLWTASPDRRAPIPMVSMFVAVGAAWYLCRCALLPAGTDSYAEGFLAHSPATYLSNTPKVIARFFLPPRHDTVQQTRRIIWLFLISATVVFYLFRQLKGRKEEARPLLLCGALWLAACVLPFIAGVSTRTSESDRFMYMPSAFLACAIVQGLLVTVRSRRVWFGLGALVLACSVQLFRGLQPWRCASMITQKVVQDVPLLIPDGRLHVYDLPDEVNGAFIFRHGFAEALLLNGVDTARVMQERSTSGEESHIHVVDPLRMGQLTRIPPDSAGMVRMHGIVIPIRSGDRVVQWSLR